MKIAKDAVDITTYFHLRLAADGTDATGLTVTNFDLQYVRSGATAAAKVDASALGAANSAHADNSAIEVDSTDQPGLYRVDWPDAAFATGVDFVYLTVKCATAFTETLRVSLESATPAVNVTQISGDSTAADNLETAYDDTAGSVRWVGIVDQGTAQSVGATDIVLRSAAAFIDDGLIGCTVVITNGTQVGSRAIITDYVGATDTATLGGGWTGATPSGTPTYQIWGSAAGADITTTLATIETKIDTVDNFLDTEIADILVDTSTTLDDAVDDLEGRLTSALATALQAHGLGIGRGVVDAASTTTAVVFKTVNGATASATDNFYNGRHIIFTSGALTLQATSISDYTGASKTATVPALTGAPAEDVTFIIV